jgi:hypothetical protein
VAQEQGPAEPGLAATPSSESATTSPGQPAAQPETESPSEPKPRPRRQTREIVTPGPLSVRGSGEHPAAPTPTIRVGAPESNKAPAETAPASPMETQSKKTPVPAAVPGTSPASGVPVIKPGQARAIQASGAFELAKTGRHTQHRTTEPRQSVVIDTQLVELVPAAPAAPAPSPSSSLRITGELQVPPSRKTSRSSPAPARITVQLDASLTEEPPTPNLAPIPAGEANKQPSGARASGDTQAPSAGSSQLAAAAGTASNPASAPSASTSARSHATVPAQGAQGPHRPSGSFSAVESDFFAREADLYKVEAESFADLDDSQGHKPGSTNKQGSSSNKRR